MSGQEEAGDDRVVARRVRVDGRVQGVFYRDSCRGEAHRLGVRGWVRNNEDGTVELHAEGPAAAVDSLVAWCGRGPTRAWVTGVHQQVVEPEGHTSFRVR